MFQASTYPHPWRETSRGGPTPCTRVVSFFSGHPKKNNAWSDRAPHSQHMKRLRTKHTSADDTILTRECP